jgi:hypothetical protein
MFARTNGVCPRVLPAPKRTVGIAVRSVETQVTGETRRSPRTRVARKLPATSAAFEAANQATQRSTALARASPPTTPGSGAVPPSHVLLSATGGGHKKVAALLNVPRVMRAGRATGCSKVGAPSLQPNLISRTGRDHSKQPSTAPSRPSHRELAPSQKVAGQTLLPRKSTVRESLDSLPAAQRKMRSAPVFVKNDEPRTCVKRVAQPSKWPAEDLAKKTPRTNMPSTVPAVVPAVGELESQAPPAAPRQKVIAPISDEPAPSRAPISKRLQRQFGGRGLPAFR